MSQLPTLPHTPVKVETSQISAARSVPVMMEAAGVGAPSPKQSPSHSFLLLQGPLGTGKTRTILSLVAVVLAGGAVNRPVKEATRIVMVRFF